MSKMDDWTDQEVAELKKLWESEIGKKYLKRMKDTQDEVLHVCMGAPDPDTVIRYAGIACGYESVMQDIESLIKSERGEVKEEKEQKAKK